MYTLVNRMAGSRAVIRAGISKASTTTSLALGLCWWAISARVRMRSLPVCFRRRAARWCKIVAALVSGQRRSRTSIGTEAMRTSHMENRHPKDGRAALDTIGLHGRVKSVELSDTTQVSREFPYRRKTYAKAGATKQAVAQADMPKGRYSSL